MRVDCPEGECLIGIPVDPLRRADQAEDDLQTTRFAILGAMTRVNGKALYAPETVRKVIAIEAMTHGADPDLAKALRILKLIRIACKDLGDHELDKGIARLQTLRRGGAAAASTGQSRLGQIESFAASQVEQSNWTRILTGRSGQR
jgi:hypothetical protein